MALIQRGEYWYGESTEDLRGELLRYSSLSYLATRFADVICVCGQRTFRWMLDDVEGVSIRICQSCDIEHPIGDSDEYLEHATLKRCACPCGEEQFEISAAASLYHDSDDLRWIYLGGRCTSCGLVACYGDWKVGGGDYLEWFSRR